MGWHRNIMGSLIFALTIRILRKRKEEFVDSIKEDVAWLGADWEDRLFLASNYFPQMYEAAVKLIKKAKHMSAI